MTKATNARKSRRTSHDQSGGTLTKVDGEVASVAPSGESVAPSGESVTEDTVLGAASDELPEPDAAHAVTEGPTAEDAKIDQLLDETVEILHDAGSVEQSDELAAAIAAEGKVPDETPEVGQTDDVVEPAESGAESPVDDQTSGDGDPGSESPTESPAAEVAAEPVDIFADLPMTKIEDYEFRDLGDAATSATRKYEAVHTAAIAAKLPMKKDWKHAGAMITLGRVKREFRAGSVYGTIEQIVSQYGRAGVPAYVLVTTLRQRQIGNKRSHYCTALPPIGWGEGWVDTYVSKGYGKVMEKKAPPITVQVVEDIAKADEVAEVQAEREAQAA